jgi:hypothetical protein
LAREDVEDTGIRGDVGWGVSKKKGIDYNNAYNSFFAWKQKKITRWSL